MTWKALYKSRWSVVQKVSVDMLLEDVQQDESITNWQQIYWEKHLQKYATCLSSQSLISLCFIFLIFNCIISIWHLNSCLDAAAEMVSITLFDGCLGDVEIPGNFFWLMCAVVVNNGVKCIRGYL